MKYTINWTKCFSTFLLLINCSMMPTSLQAQKIERHTRLAETWDDKHVIVFDKCGYKGYSKRLPLAQIKDMNKAGVELNAISSIIIPKGLAVEVFQYKDFSGYWYRLNQSSDCLKGNWNNRIKSIRVLKDVPSNSFGFTQHYKNKISRNKCIPFSVSTKNGDAAIRFIDQGSGMQLIKSGKSINGETCQRGQVRIELAKRTKHGDAILNIGDLQYSFEPRGRYDDYRDKWYRKYLSIDLSSIKKGSYKHPTDSNWGNTIGFGKRYSSGVRSGENWGNNYPKGWKKRQTPKHKNDSLCIEYTVSGSHKDTGIRFLTGEHEFVPVGSKTSKNKLCHIGPVKVEMGKRRTDAEVVLSIGGKTHTFEKGDKGDRYLRTWYRKIITVQAR